MNSIHPKTYNEVLRLKRCLSLKNHLPRIENEQLRRIYDFLTENGDGRVTISDGMISFLDAESAFVDGIAIQTPERGMPGYFEIITMTAATINVVRPYTGGSGGDSGISGNNNNNNNNNNNG